MLLSAWKKAAPFVCAALLTLGFASPRAHAQALETASKSTNVSVFGGYLFQKPNNQRGTNSGAVVGANLTQHFKHLLAPSMEIRGMSAGGTNTTERSLVGGFRLVANAGRFQPYLDGEAGGGVIHFKNALPPYKDRSFIWVAGGGFDYDVTSHFNLKADLQVQRWNLSSQHPAPFHPVNVTVGVAYHFPFRMWNKHSDFNY